MSNSTVPGVAFVKDLNAIVAQNNLLGLPGGYGIPYKATASTTCVLHRSSVTGTTAKNYDDYEFWVPVGSGGYYFVSVFSTRRLPAAIKSFVKAYVGRPGTFTWHDAGGMSNTGTWTGSANTSSMYGSYKYSIVAGSTMSCSATGTILGIQIFQSTNAGYGIVGIDGDYTAAELLPMFTDADYVDGKCRATDVGKRYFNCYNANAMSQRIPITKLASDATHTVTIEVTGTKLAASSDVRCYMEGIVGVSGAVLPPTANVHMLPLYFLYGASSSWSAQAWVASWAPTGSTDYQFLGENHADNVNGKETETSWSIIVDSTDQTAIARGDYATGQFIQFDQVSDVYHKNNLSVAVATKTKKFTFAARRKLPMMLDISILWLVDGLIAYEYPIMLTTPDDTMPINGFLIDYFTRGYMGGVKFDIPKNYDNSSSSWTGESNTLIVAGDEVAYFGELLFSNPPDTGERRTYTNSWTDRIPTSFKMYKVKMTKLDAPSPYKLGDTIRYIMGWGAMVNPKGYL